MKLSFVIPSYNSACWLAMAVDSCLQQTYKNVEVVVVDDCSTDSTGQYLDWLAKEHPEVVIVRNAKNMGRSYSRNIGNEVASGEIIAVLDADDLATPKRAEWTVARFQKGCQFLYGSAVQIDALGEIQGELKADVFDAKKAEETLENRIVHSTCAYLRSLALKHPYRDGNVAEQGIDDWAFQTELFKSGVKLEFMTNTLCAYRILSTAISNTRDAGEVKKAKAAFLEAISMKEAAIA